jgi:glycosyltransferase involved in cell wall biosynthesis
MAQALTQGGSERQLAETAKAIDRGRFSPHVGVLRPDGFRSDELRDAGIPVACFRLPSFKSPRALAEAAWAMGKYLREQRIRVVHSFDAPGNMFAVPVARAFQTPIVVSSQRAFRALVPEGFRRFLRFTDCLVDAVVVNCRALERHLIEDEKVSPALIRLCRNGIDTTVFRPGPNVRPPELEGASLAVGVVCALRPEKGLPSLVEAFARARHGDPGMRLVIVGSGPVLPELEQLRERLGLGGACVFAPSTPDVVRWLRAIDIFVLPSLSEAFSNSLMEAMACGCAVVASRVGGNPELVEHGERGLLFQAGDPDDLAAQIARLAKDEAERRRMAESGQRFIAGNFSIATAANRMAEIYSDLLRRKAC